jgi:hypothetical protein
MLEAHDDVIGAAPDDDLTLSMALLPSVCPKAIDVIKDLLDFDRGNVRTAANNQVCFLRETNQRLPFILSHEVAGLGFAACSWAPGQKSS